MRNNIQRSWAGLLGALVLMSFSSPLCAQGQQSSSSSTASTETAVIAAVASIVVAVISLVGTVINARNTKAIQKANPISLDELLKPDKIEAIRSAGHFVTAGGAISLDELLKQVNIDAIKDRGRFVSEKEVLEKLIECAATDKDKLFSKFGRMVLDKLIESVATDKDQLFSKFRSMVLEKSEVARLGEMTTPEQAEFLMQLRSSLGRL